MTGMEPTAPGAPDDARTPKTAEPLKVEAAFENASRGEILVDGPSVIASFYLPEVEPAELDFRVGARTLSVWSKRAGTDFRTILILPVWIRADQFVLTHKNGVYEFLMESVPGLAA